MYIIKNKVSNHFKDHATIYVFIMILFLTGVIFGAIIVNSMEFNQKQDILFYLERYLGQIVANETTENQAILVDSFLLHVKSLLLLFTLGLTVIGLPLVWILVFMKGLAIGFSVGFIVNQFGLKGLILASLSIAPQNLLIIPMYIIAGSLSMLFSLTLISILFNQKGSSPITLFFRNYVVMFSLLLSISFGAALLEAFVAHEAMQSFIRSFY
ncbi:MAG TPA: stage II sporulation protein M [Candidatus Dormibacteraeota bacterium]|nr:stage II sporulation protein M [Candidatus Dormibacteraeota bacterium]